MGNFLTDLQRVINSHSKEKGSNTPDMILAEYLASILASFDEIMRRRDKWYRSQNKSDGFQWTDELVKEFAEFQSTRLHFPVGYMLIEFIASHTPKPQAENKPDRDWCILQFINKKGDHTWDYDGLNNDYVGSRHGARFPEQSLLDSRDGRSSVANGDVFINKVFRKSDGEVFSVGDEVDIRIGAFNQEGWQRFTSTITKFQIVNGKMFIECGTCSGSLEEAISLTSYKQKQRPPQPQKEEPLFSDRPIFTPKQYEEYGRKCFDAGRDRIGGWWNDQIHNWKFNSYEHFKTSSEDYKNSKQ